MYFSKPILQKAFRGLRKIHPVEGGKARLERVSALRHLFATSQLLKEYNSSEIDLSVGSAARQKFPDAVGNFVSLGKDFLYTKNFGQQFGNQKDYAVGNNFLTTILARSKKVSESYPKRPAPMLFLAKEHVSILDDAFSALVGSYGINNVKVELSLWLLRFTNISLHENRPDIETLQSHIKNSLLQIYTSDLINVFAPSNDDLRAFFEDIDGSFLDTEKVDLSDLADGPATQNNNDEDTQVLLDDSDPTFKRVRESIDLKGELNFLFFGVPGTGKTWYASKIARALTNGDKKRVEFIQFHSSVSYDDFVEGFVPEVTASSTSVTYTIQKKHFLEFATKASEDTENTYVMVIDEISRGDPSRIFGELLTYIEPSYRGEFFTLMYSREQCSIPQNLIILATANPYDRSVSEMDDAFLRRFYMIEFVSDTDVLKKKLESNDLDPETIRKIIHFFSTVEEAMPFGFGHAQFFNIFSIQDMREFWESKLRFLLNRSLQFEEQKFLTVQEKYDELFSENPPPEEPLEVADETP